MFILLVSVFLGTGQSVNGETHSLVYLHMTIFKPAGAPGVREFTPGILMNSRTIEVPELTLGKKQRLSWSWKEEREHLQEEQEEFRLTINFMMEQMKVNSSDVHLRYLYGCEGDVQPDNTLRFHRGVDAYNVDGRPILSINDTGYVWVADTPEAEPIAKHWNDDKLLMRVTRTKLEWNCMRHLKNLKEYQTLQFEAAPPPDVYVFSTEAKVKNNLVLSCLATGFYPKDIVLKITRNHRVLTREDGLMSTGVRPNEDDTFQRRDSVEILKSDLSTYSCEIIYNKQSNKNVTKVWDHAPPLGGDAGIIGGAVVAVVLILVGLGVLLIVLYKKGYLGPAAGNEANTIRGQIPNTGDKPENTKLLTSSKDSVSGGSVDSGASSYYQTLNPETANLREED